MSTETDLDMQTATLWLSSHPCIELVNGQGKRRGGEGRGGEGRGGTRVADV